LPARLDALRPVEGLHGSSGEVRQRLCAHYSPRSSRGEASSPGCDGCVRCKDAGSGRIGSDTDATEDAAARVPSAARGLSGSPWLGLVNPLGA
jgi:hypothetical protein